MTKKGDIPVSDERLVEKTGRTWEAWFAHLDDFGAAEAGHKATAAHLQDELDVPAWYAQTITVAYERERGLRAPGQTSAGHFEVAVRRTVPVDARTAFRAVSQPEGWNGWFTSDARMDLREGGAYETADGDVGTFLLVAPPTRLRMTWEHQQHCPGTVVEFLVEDRGAGRSTVEVRHTKIPDEAGYQDMKSGWQGAMDQLQSHLTPV